MAVIVPSVVITILFITALTAQIWISRTAFVQPIARISQNGELLYELPLSGDAEIQLDGNRVQIHDGRIGVIDATCPDKVCVNMGFVNGAIPVICLPNRLEVQVSENKSDLDGITG